MMNCRKTLRRTWISMVLHRASGGTASARNQARVHGVHVGSVATLQTTDIRALMLQPPYIECRHVLDLVADAAASSAHRAMSLYPFSAFVMTRMRVHWQLRQQPSHCRSLGQPPARNSVQVVDWRPSRSRCAQYLGTLLVVVVATQQVKVQVVVLCRVPMCIALRADPL